VGKSKRKKSRTRVPAKYDASRWAPLKAQIEATAPARAEFDAEEKRRALREQLHERIHTLLLTVASGTPEQPTRERGDLGIAPALWAKQVIKLAHAWKEQPGLYDHGQVPRILNSDNTPSAGYDAGRDVFDLACRGGSSSEVARCITDGRDNLRELRARGTTSSPTDAPSDMAHYFDMVATWYRKTGGDVWKNGIKDLSIALSPRAWQARSASVSSRDDGVASSPEPSRHPKSSPVLKTLADYGNYLVTMVDLKRFLSMDIDMSTDGDVKPRMPSPVWSGPRRRPWYRLRELMALIDKAYSRDLSKTEINQWIIERLKAPDAKPAWHQEATFGPGGRRT
jgi:hypothetical protein